MERETDSERTRADIGVPFFFSGGPHWAAHPLSARPRCQVAMSRGWGKAPSPWVDPCHWGGRLPGGPSGSLPWTPASQRRHASSWPGRPWKSWTGVWNSWRPCRPTAPSARWPRTRWAGPVAGGCGVGRAAGEIKIHGWTQFRDRTSMFILGHGF